MILMITMIVSVTTVQNNH